MEDNQGQHAKHDEGRTVVDGVNAVHQFFLTVFTDRQSGQRQTVMYLPSYSMYIQAPQCMQSMIFSKRARAAVKGGSVALWLDQFGSTPPQVYELLAKRGSHEQRRLSIERLWAFYPPGPLNSDDAR